MIRIVFRRNSDGQFTGYSAKGHAGYAEAGADIVCAAVSVLGATCVNSLESVCGVVPLLEENGDGALAFRLPHPLDAARQHDAQVLLRALEQGLRDVAEQFPQYIRLSYKMGGKCNDEAQSAAIRS